MRSGVDLASYADRDGWPIRVEQVGEHDDLRATLREPRRPPERGGKVPAAALTAYARAGDRTRVLSAGFSMHLPKPIEPEKPKPKPKPKPAAEAKKPDAKKPAADKPVGR